MYQGYDPERIGIMPVWLIEFIKMHQKDHPDAKFKIGDKVIHKNCKLNPCEILAVNVQEKGIVEYALNDHYWLVYEEELVYK